MDKLNNVLSVLRTNPYASATTSLFLVLYAGLAAPALPASIAGLFEHSVFKLLILVLILVLLKGQNVTVALLVAIGFVVSMGTLSRYRTFTMANELSRLNPWGKRADDAFGPDAQQPTGPINVSKWSSKNGVNRLNIRGYEYAGNDEPNHLPGGHGDMDKKAEQALEQDLDQAQEHPTGYRGHSFATIGAPDSQL